MRTSIHYELIVLPISTQSMSLSGVSDNEIIADHDMLESNYNCEILSVGRDLMPGIATMQGRVRKIHPSEHAC